MTTTTTSAVPGTGRVPMSDRQSGLLLLRTERRAECNKKEGTVLPCLPAPSLPALPVISIYLIVFFCHAESAFLHYLQKACTHTDTHMQTAGAW